MKLIPLFLIGLVFISGCTGIEKLLTTTELGDCERKCISKGYESGECKRTIINLSRPCSLFGEKEIGIGKEYCTQIDGLKSFESMCCCEK